jgi:hypothetical protein
MADHDYNVTNRLAHDGTAIMMEYSRQLCRVTDLYALLVSIAPPCFTRSYIGPSGYRRWSRRSIL